MSLSNGVLGLLGLGVSAASTTMSARAAYEQAQAQRQAAEYNAGIYDYNAGIKDLQAKMALEQGEHAVAAAKEEGHQKIETQRASFVASGVKVDSGSALDVVAEQAGKNAYDQSMIRYNSEVAAWGYNVEASSLRQQANVTRATGSSISPSLAAASSLLSGGTSMFNQYRQYQMYGS